MCDGIVWILAKLMTRQRPGGRLQLGGRHQQERDARDQFDRAVETFQRQRHDECPVEQ